MDLEGLKRIGKILLKENGKDEREARLLLAFALHKNENELIKLRECTDDEAYSFISFVKMRIKGIPYAYICGQKEFMKLNFTVNQSVLIPRPETELLVEEALKYSCNKVLDLCTGSGCIAVSIAYYGEKMQVEASDISNEALMIAEENAKKNGVSIKFIQSDLFENIENTYDIIVSNPPYIEEKIISSLEKEVQNEPYIALSGGEDGLLFYRRIIENAKNFLNSNGILILEIGYNQRQDVKELLERYQYEDIECIKDLSGNDRVMVAKKK